MMACRRVPQVLLAIPDKRAALRHTFERRRPATLARYRLRTMHAMLSLEEELKKTRDRAPLLLPIRQPILLALCRALYRDVQVGSIRRVERRLPPIRRRNRVPTERAPRRVAGSFEQGRTKK